MTPNDNQVKLPELLPCPWCGDDLSEASVSEGSTFRWRKVDGCCTDGPEVRHDTLADDQEEAERNSRQRAIGAWNTRALRSAQVQQEAVGYVHPIEFEEMKKEGGSIKLGDRSEAYGRTMPLYTAPPADALGAVRELAAQMRHELAADKGLDYTEYEKGRIAEKQRCLSLLESALAQSQQPHDSDDALADTQRAIIEAAERRGYERALSEQPPATDALGAVSEVACDMHYLMGRASRDGHEVGQRLASEIKAKLESALAQAPASGKAVAPFGYCVDFETGLFECSHKFYYLAPGQPVPEGCTPFYTTPPAPVPAVRVTDELVEHAAREVWKVDRDHWLGGSAAFIELHPSDHARLSAIARAALEAALGQENGS